MAKVLVTGGAGYIGAHACKALAQAGYTPVAFDNLSTGHRAAVKFGPLVEGDLLNRAAIDAALAEHAPIAVMHFAALSQVGESMQDPGRYWRENVVGGLNLIEATQAAGIDKFIFSSTCATYGDQDGVVLNEETEQHPINAYGGSKLAIEQMLRDFSPKGLTYVIFRYFNVAGADPDAEVGEAHDPETHLVPLILQAVAGTRGALTIFGTDYDTADGTCLRDYVHVSDLVDAHVAGLKWLEEGKSSEIFCLGTGDGFSVREVVAAAAAVTNGPVPIEEGPRRAGDAVKLVCGSDKARTQLGWTPSRSTMPQMLRDAHRWHASDGF
ncbi:UDP-glucose 4-epimerase GalE [Sulfitobacter sp.]|jgi:UDP-glucose 4-epimerase|uniref:UDP-glucose 4-epimerase GalE n=1 Tax=Sulfitobacter sp. TaxID=1903071 RepID=UPI00260DF6AE|nr:UDP-glucose 4-epimerase GalE [Sulfitobacter sp.]